MVIVMFYDKFKNEKINQVMIDGYDQEGSKVLKLCLFTDGEVLEINDCPFEPNFDYVSYFVNLYNLKDVPMILMNSESIAKYVGSLCKIANYNYITYALYAYKNEQWYNVSRKTYVSRKFGLFDEVKFIKGLSLMDIPFISLEEPDSVNLLDCPNKKMVKKI